MHRNVKELLAELSLEEKVYQTVIQRSEGYLYDEATAEERLAENPLGGFFVGEEIIGSETMKGDDIVHAIERANRYSKIPPIICADTEFGCGYMFPDHRYSDFPWQMTLGATADPALAYDFGKYTAIPAREIGVNLSLGPVADLNMNFMNPVVNTRAIGDDPQLVRTMLSSMVKGMQEYGMGATAKHFPGDGVDYRDQHYVLTSNTLSVEEWWETFGAVYKELIESGVLCIMAGHISFPAYQKERVDGIAPPATLSKELITGLLKQELGFKYAVMSDAVCMNAFRTVYCDQTTSELECFKAGVDLLLWPGEGYVPALIGAVRSGEIPMSRLDDAVERILLLKQELGLFGDKAFETDDMTGVFGIDRRTAEQAITLVRDRNGLLPCGDRKNIAVIALTDYADERESLSVFVQELAADGARVTVFHGEVTGPTDGYDLFIYCTFCHQHKPVGYLQITPSWQTASLSKQNTIVAAFGSPYLINSNFPTVNTAIALYSDTEQCLRTAAKGILGKVGFPGRLPVKLQPIC